MTLGRRGLPRLPVAVRHRRRVHGAREPWRSASSSRSRPTCARCATSPRSSTPGSGVVVHEVVADGSIWYGKDRRRADPATGDGSTTSTRTSRQVPEHRRADLALDRRRRVPRRDARVHGAQARYVRTSSTPTATAGRRATATSSAPAWARRSSTTPSTHPRRSTTSPTWRGGRADGGTPTGPRPRRRPRAPLRGHVVDRGRARSTPTRSTTRATQTNQKHWIGQTRWRPS